MIIDLLLRFLYPPRCNFCNVILKENSKYYLCSNCISKIKFVDENSCSNCGKKLIKGYIDLCADCRTIKHYFNRAYSIAEYKDVIKKSLIALKFFNKKRLVNTFVELLALKVNKINNIDLVIAVPLYRQRLIERGYNQSENLAKLLAQKIGVDFDNKNLIKVRNTVSQSTLPRKSRLKNLKGAFKVIDNSIFDGKAILLIDDIYTTGATVSECAKVLKKSGASKVYVLTVASGEGY